MRPLSAAVLRDLDRLLPLPGKRRWGGEPVEEAGVLAQLHDLAEARGADLNTADKKRLGYLRQHLQARVGGEDHEYHVDLRARRSAEVRRQPGRTGVRLWVSVPDVVLDRVRAASPSELGDALARGLDLKGEEQHGS